MIKTVANKTILYGVRYGRVVGGHEILLIFLSEKGADDMIKMLKELRNTIPIRQNDYIFKIRFIKETKEEKIT